MLLLIDSLSLSAIQLNQTDSRTPIDAAGIPLKYVPPHQHMLPTETGRRLLSRTVNALLVWPFSANK